MQVPVLRGTMGMVGFYDGVQATNEHRGWVIGTFVTTPEGEPLTSDFEVKWHKSKAGEKREEWSRGLTGSAMTIIIQGVQELFFAPDGENGRVVSRVLTKGMVAIWENSVPHKWRTIEDTELICVRRLR